MTRHKILLVLSMLAVVRTSPADGAYAAGASEQTLVAFDRYPGHLISTQDSRVTIAERDAERWLQVTTGHATDWPGITLPAPDQSWDLSSWRQIMLRVRNIDTSPVTVYCRVDSPGGDGVQSSITEHVQLQPGQTKELKVTLTRLLPKDLAEKLYGMRGYPGGHVKDQGIDARQVTQLIVFVNKPTQAHLFQVSTIRAVGTATPAAWWEMAPDEFFPMIDGFGQFRHADWPGKVKSADELTRDVELEEEDLKRHPGPEGWNQYGGWEGGPQLKATGYFYPIKYAGKWWLVDPRGRLFWSHGVDCVGCSQGTTPITDREFYFAKLPDAASPSAFFYGEGSWAPHGYYREKGTYRTYNFAGANLLRKHGQAWEQKAAQAIHRRLRSWAMNTIGNWSDASVFLLRRTPYVVAIDSGGGAVVEGSSGYWGKFPDPFDRSFRAALDRSMNEQRHTTAGDPWCLGYFVDNELAWGDEFSLAAAALASPPEQAAKQAFLSDLREQHGAIEELNEAWGTGHESWEALEACRTPPDIQKAAQELGAFYTRLAEQYFRHCREAVKQVAPDNLYLGCRFAWVNDRGARAAAKYCDVMGYNLYHDEVANFRLPEGLDVPVIIGEFHFGALDRGMFHAGLRPTGSQDERAEAYRRYVTGAVRHPSLVGTHWFQYGDQATTGRGDGENYQIGLVTICDRPYPETIAAVRQVGAAMYRIRHADNE